MTTPLQLYRALLKNFGPQGWWPVTPRGGFQAVYEPRRARALSEREQFEICVGAILTQNTAWTNVMKALEALHRARLMDPQTIAGSPQPRLAKFIRSSGYFRQKAKKLKLFARYLVENYDGAVGKLLKKPLSGLREELLALHGVGPETADSMLLYAGGRPAFVVDAYTRRIGVRIGFFKTQDYRAVQSFFERRLPKSVSLYNEFHALLVALGKDFCRTRPQCSACPALQLCRTGRASLLTTTARKR